MIKRQFNFLGQARCDVPHLRSLESSVANDFDLLCGQVMAGSKPLVITGFEIVSPASAIGGHATSLQLNVANGILFHPKATEAGTIFSVVSGTAAEVLDSTNANVTGSFTPSTINYVGLDLHRTADDSTSDLVEFLDANTLLENPRVVPLGRTLSYKIIISTADFDSDATILPIAEITTDSGNLVTVVTDARSMMYRLGTGGTVPDAQNAYSWAQGRNEATDNSLGATFQGGDKSISSQKDYFDALMTRLWELGGGEYWYSATSDRDVRLTLGPPTPLLANGDNFYWDGTLIRWEKLSVIFANSTGTYNVITDNSVGLSLPDGYCIYVDIDRSANSTLTVPAAVPMSTLGSPVVPGSRIVLAWRRGASVWTRTEVYETGRQYKAATNVAGSSGEGVVRLSIAGTTYPTVIPLDANGSCVNTATAGNTSAFEGHGVGAGAGLSGYGGATGDGIDGFAGAGAGYGVGGVGGAGGGAGVFGLGASSATPGIGVKGRGGDGTSGGANGKAGVSGTGGAANGGGYDGNGVEGFGGGTAGPGGYFQGAAGGGTGCIAAGRGAGAGVSGTGGSTNGTGVTGQGVLAGTGVIGTGGLAGSGGEFTAGANGGDAVRLTTTTGNAISILGTAGEVKFTTNPRTRHIIVTAQEMLNPQGGATLGLGTYGGVWVGSSNASFTLLVRVKVPAGSIITGAYVLVTTTDTVAANGTLTLVNNVAIIPSGYAGPTNIYSAVNWPIPSNTQAWEAVGALTTANFTIADDSITFGTVVAPLVTSGKTVSIQGLRITYTQSQISHTV